MKKTLEILQDNELRKTPCRLFVLEEFRKKSKQSLSEADLETKAKGKFDRVTIYRTLNTFIEYGILHKVMDDNNAIRFAMCSDTCGNRHHNHEHVHFKCESCNTTSCLDDISIVNVELPKGYKKKEASYLIVGICAGCNN